MDSGPQCPGSVFSSGQSRPAVVNLGPLGHEDRRHSGLRGAWPLACSCPWRPRQPHRSGTPTSHRRPEVPDGPRGLGCRQQEPRGSWQHLQDTARGLPREGLAGRAPRGTRAACSPGDSVHPRKALGAGGARLGSQSSWTRPTLWVTPRSRASGACGQLGRAASLQPAPAARRCCHGNLRLDSLLSLQITFVNVPDVKRPL